MAAAMMMRMTTTFSVHKKWQWQCCSTGDFEPKDLNFLELSRREHPGKQWHELSLQQQVEVIRNGLRPNTYLIDPHSSYMKYWDILIAACLFFTGVVTPFEVIFMGALNWDDPLFMIERLVDIVFMKDILMQFFLKIEVASEGKRGTVLLKEPWRIRMRYLRSWFLLDAISVLPFDIFFILSKDTSNSEALLNLKFVRMARLLRLVKLLRMLRTSRLILRWQTYSTISFAMQKLAKFSFGLLLSSHWMACAWGLVGYMHGRDLCDDSGNRVFFDDEIPPEESSWITALFEGGKHSPDNPCNPWHVYTAALHWSVMTITSIGYGDIVPVRNAEYLAGVVFMLLGGVVWANIIGGTCAIIAKGDPVEANYESNTDLLNSMMREGDFPAHKHQHFREYLREAKARDTVGQFRSLAQRFSPLLKGELLLHSTRMWIKHVDYLRTSPELFQMALADSMKSNFYSRKEGVNISSEVLCVVERGTVARGGKIIIPGAVFHLDFIVHLPWLRKWEDTICLTYSLIFTLHRDHLFRHMADFPQVQTAVRNAAVRLALMRCVRLCAARYRGGDWPTAESLREEPPSLVDIFRNVSSEVLMRPKIALRSERRASEVRRTLSKKCVDFERSDGRARDGNYDEQLPEREVANAVDVYMSGKSSDGHRSEKSLRGQCVDAEKPPHVPKSAAERPRRQLLGFGSDSSPRRFSDEVACAGRSYTSPPAMTQESPDPTADGDLAMCDLRQRSGMALRLDALELALQTSQRTITSALDEVRVMRSELGGTRFCKV